MSQPAHATARSAMVVSALSGLSPALGVASEMALAWQFGTSPTVDAFRIAALLLVFGQQVLVLNILPHVVVPVFADYRAAGREKEAWTVTMTLANMMLAPTLAASLLAFCYPEPIVRLLGPGLTGQGRDTAAFFVRWFVPTYVSLVWSGIATGVLYAHNIFGLPQIAQSIGNTIMVFSILSLGRVLGATSLVLAVLTSSLAVMILCTVKLLPLMRRAGAHYTLRFNIHDPGVRRAAKMAAPLVGLALLTQCATAIVYRALSGLAPGNVALYAYAWKLGQLALVVPFSLAIVLFPQFANAHATSESGQLREMCTRALRMTLFITVLLACPLYGLRGGVVTLLFQRGAFSYGSSEAVATLFGLLLFGTPAASAIVLLQKVFYAFQRASIPMYAQLGQTVLLAMLCGAAALRFGATGVIFLHGVLTPWLVAGALLLVLGARVRVVSTKGLLHFLGGLLVLGALGGWAAARAGSLLASVKGGAVLTTVGGSACGLVVSFAVARALHVPEAIQCGGYIRWQAGAILRRLRAARRRQASASW